MRPLDFFSVTLLQLDIFYTNYYSSNYNKQLYVADVICIRGLCCLYAHPRQRDPSSVAPLQVSFSPKGVFYDFPNLVKGLRRVITMQTVKSSKVNNVCNLRT